MKEAKFSTGLKVRAYVGDGFDGSSGLYLSVERPYALSYEHVKNLKSKELSNLLKIVEWFIEKESALRRWEGSGMTNHYAVQETYGTYAALFFAGQLDLLKQFTDTERKEKREFFRVDGKKKSF